MDRFYQDRICARRVLLDQIAEIDRLSDAEIDDEAKRHQSPSLAILELCKKSRVERELTHLARDGAQNVKGDVPAARSADFLYGDDGMPE
jgi:hypothetical protein